MHDNSFSHIIDSQVQTCLDILSTRSNSYANPEDRLHNFRQAAALEKITVPQALAGVMVKHTVSLYDMCWDNGDYPLEVWTEKITDHINYLLILKAAIIDKLSEGSDQPIAGL